jgi:hypothetical protein
VYEDLEARVKILKADTQRLEEQLELLKRAEADARLHPKDIYSNDDVVRFNKFFGNRPYTYVAIKANGRWYCTARDQFYPLTWSELMRIHDGKYPKYVDQLIRSPFQPSRSPINS